MALLNDHLTLWEIGFQWAGYDPDRLWIRIPLPVRNNFRVLMDAILEGHLECFSLSLEKWRPESEFGPEFFIRHYLDQANECVEGNRFNRKLLNWAVIDRWAMQQWCERQGVPLPEFWFPPGWKLEYEWPDGEDKEVPTAGRPPVVEALVEKEFGIDKRHRIKMACQQLALWIWSQEPAATLKELAGRKEIDDMAGGSNYQWETVRDWISEVDPRNPATKRGRKRKNNPGSDPAGQ